MGPVEPLESKPSTRSPRAGPPGVTLRRAALAMAALVLALLGVAGAHAFVVADDYYEARDDESGGPVNQLDVPAPDDPANCLSGDEFIPNGRDGNTDNLILTGTSGTSDWDLHLYEEEVNGLFVDVNGYISLRPDNVRPTSKFTSHELPDSFFSPDGFFAVLWEDLDASVGEVCWAIGGTAPDRHVVVRYKEVPFDGSAKEASFMAYVYENSSALEAHFLETASDDDGKEESLGIESFNGFLGLQYEYTEEDDRDGTLQYRPVGVYPHARPNHYTYDFNLTQDQILKVDGTAYVLPLANDRQIGHVTLTPRYIDGLPMSAAIYPLDEDGVCDWASPNEFDLSSRFCFVTSDSNPCVSGPYVFTYHADDAFPDDLVEPRIDRTTITIEAYNCNRPPKGEDDTVYVVEDKTRILPAPGLLENDEDPDDEPFYIENAGLQPTGINGGQLTLDADGGLTYVPAPDFIGEELYQYRLIDERGLRAIHPDNVTIVVRKDLPPIADFLGPTRVLAGVPFTLADVSYDGEGPIVARSWDFGMPSPAGMTAPTHVYPYPGIQYVSLTVTDDAGVSATMVRTIIVDPTPPAAPSKANTDPDAQGHRDFRNRPGEEALVTVTVTATSTTPPAPPAFRASAGDGLQVVEGNTLEFRGSAFNGKQPYSYAWHQSGGPAATLDATPGAAEAAIQAPAVPYGGAVLRFTLTATDAAGKVATDEVDILVLDEAHAPLLGKVDRIRGTEGTEVVLRANATDADGDELAYTWTQLGGELVQLEGADTPAPTFMGPAGDYTFQVTVWDGELGAARLVAVRIAPAPVPEPEPVAQRSVPRDEAAAPWWLWALGAGGLLAALLLVVAIVVAARRPDTKAQDGR